MINTLLAGIRQWVAPSPKSTTLRYQRGLMRRYAREGEAWTSHLENTKQAIRDFAQREQPKELTILGSGWHLDIPKEELLENGVKLTLCDIAHPPQIRELCENNPRIQLLEIDITGGLHKELRKVNKRNITREQLISLCSNLVIPTEIFNLEQPVVSLNLISQLPYPIIEQLSGRLEWESIAEASAILQEAHLKFLQKFPAVLLMSDTHEAHYDIKNHRLIQRVPTVHIPLPEAEISGEWVWRFDETGHYHEFRCVHLPTVLRAWSNENARKAKN